MAADTTQHSIVRNHQPPDGSIKVWRYIDLPKLIDFLQTKSLHFAGVSALGDPYEGALPVGNREQYSQQHPHIPDERINESFQADVLDRINWYRDNNMYINCWHASATESAAMWSLYATGSGSVVLQSTYDKLRDAMPSTVGPEHVDLGIGVVKYLDYGDVNTAIPVDEEPMTAFMCKRQEFRHEQEVRCITLGDPGSWEVRVDVGIDFVETIRIQPTAPRWIREVIMQLTEKYGVKAWVHPSDISMPPLPH